MAILHVKAVPGASRSRVCGRYGDGIRVQVAQAPERGKANAAVIAVLADWLNVDPRRITLASGATSPRKVFQIEGLTDDDLNQRLREID